MDILQNSISLHLSNFRGKYPPLPPPGWRYQQMSFGGKIWKGGRDIRGKCEGKKKRDIRQRESWSSKEKGAKIKLKRGRGRSKFCVQRERGKLYIFGGVGIRILDQYIGHLVCNFAHWLRARRPEFSYGAHYSPTLILTLFTFPSKQLVDLPL